MTEWTLIRQFNVLSPLFYFLFPKKIIIYIYMCVCVHIYKVWHFLQGTQLYDPKAGGWKDLGMLDVMQVRFKVFLL